MSLPVGRAPGYVAYGSGNQTMRYRKAFLELQTGVVALGFVNAATLPGVPGVPGNLAEIL